MVGPLTRSVADARLIAEVLTSGHAGNADADLDGVQLAWCRGEGTAPVAAPIVEAVESMAGLLAEDLSRSVPEDAPTAMREAAPLFREVRATDPTEDIRRLLGDAEPGPVIRVLLDSERPVSAEHVADLRLRVAELREQMLEQMPDVLLLPVAAIGAPGLTERTFAVEGGTLGPWDVLACRQAISLFGLPAAVTPIGTFTDGRTIGVQVVVVPVETTSCLRSRSGSRHSPRRRHD